MPQTLTITARVRVGGSVSPFSAPVVVTIGGATETDTDGAAAGDVAVGTAKVGEAPGQGAAAADVSGGATVLHFPETGTDQAAAADQAASPALASEAPVQTFAQGDKSTDATTAVYGETSGTQGAQAGDVSGGAPVFAESGNVAGAQGATETDTYTPGASSPPVLASHGTMTMLYVSTASIPLPPGVTAGDLLVLIATSSSGTPTGYTAVTGAAQYPNVYYKIAGSSETAPTITPQRAIDQAVLLRVTGAFSTPLDSSYGNTGGGVAGTSATASSWNTGHSNELIVAAGFCVDEDTSDYSPNAGSPSTPSGMTLSVNSGSQNDDGSDQASMLAVYWMNAPTSGTSISKSFSVSGASYVDWVYTGITTVGIRSN